MLIKDFVSVYFLYTVVPVDELTAVQEAAGDDAMRIVNGKSTLIVTAVDFLGMAWTLTTCISRSQHFYWVHLLQNVYT